MSGTDDELFICSFCEQKLKISAAHIGKRVKCPKCCRIVFLYPNQTTEIESYLTSTWHYERPRFLFGFDRIGPIQDEQFLQLVRNGEIQGDFEVSSPQITKSVLVPVGNIHLSIIQEQVDQRIAETQRRIRKTERKRAIAATNMERLSRAVAAAVADGRITLREREQLVEFARTARIPESTVESLLSAEAGRLIETLVEESLSDGILSQSEKQRISELALGLGVNLSLTENQLQRLEACELAAALADGSFSPGQIDTQDVVLNAGETPVARAEVEWHEVVQQKKPVGIALGDDHYLKRVANGDCILTNKRLVFIGPLTAKKVTLTSIERIRRFQDGTFCHRSSGKSIFLKSSTNQAAPDSFSMLVEFVVSRQPVLAISPSESFIPDVQWNIGNNDTAGWSSFDSQEYVSEPRYTFRVVGDHIGDRSYWIEQNGVGDLIHLVREPSNPHDANAVAVFDAAQHHLGYLKREVAEWFGPMLDRGCAFHCQAFRKPSSGGLIIAVYNR